jgi:molybdopterin-containing oxidoreductase family membrane subunit
MFSPTFWDYSTFVGTLGLFLALLFLFLRFLPMISIFEMRELVYHADEEDRHAT